MNDNQSDDDFYEYLEDGGVEKDAIESMKKEKIRASTLPLMDNESLSKYLPLEGDRHLARNYRKSAMPKSLSVLDRLRLKLGQKKEEGGISSRRRDSKASSMNSMKSTRKIEVGWMDYDFKTNSYKQVRARTGGGTRSFSVDKNSTPSDILKKAKELFFPQNISSRGRLQDFDYSLLDFKMDGPENATVGSLYEKTNMRMLRFYLCTKRNTKDETNLVTPPDNDLNNNEGCIDDDSEIAFGPTSDSSDEAPTLPFVQNNQDLLKSVLDFSNISNEDMPGFEGFTPPSSSTPVRCSHDQGISSSDYQRESEQPDQTFALEPLMADSSHSAVLADCPDVQSTTIIEVVRGDTLPGMIEAFSSEQILQKLIQVSMLLPNGKKEKGEGTGVLIDCITEFWEEFYERCTLGTHEKVPCLRHDFREKQWQAVCRVLLYGWHHFQFLPVQIAKAFMLTAFGFSAAEEELINSFLNFVGEEEGQILRKSQHAFDSVEIEELLDVLGRFNCKKVPKKDSMRSLLSEISHKELLQEPMYVLDSWKSLIKTAPIDRTEIENFYKSAVPTPRKVIKRLDFPANIGPTEQQTSEYLKRFIIESDVRTLKLLLRYCTGFNILVKKNEKIGVTFSAMSLFTRRPIGHTCGVVLELAVEYPNYPSFRSEMRSVLDSGIWTLDIV